MKEKIKEIFNIWKKTHRLDVLVGIAISILLLGLSFVRPYVDTILYLGFFPSILYGLFYAYKIMKIGKRLDQIKTSLNNQEVR